MAVEIFKIHKNGNVIKHLELENTYKGAYTIWNYFTHKFFNKQVDTSELDMEFWSLYQTNKLNIHEKIMLLTTCDDMIILKKDMPKVIEAFLSILENFNNPNNNEINKYSYLMEYIHILADLYLDDDCIGMAWNQHSINCGTWEVQYKNESYPYNIFKHRKHFDVVKIAMRFRLNKKIFKPTKRKGSHRKFKK